MRRMIAMGAVCCFAAGAVIAQAVDPKTPGSGPGTPRDLWIHPRGASYDPKLHYRDTTGELYFHAENEIRGSLSDLRVVQQKPLRLSVAMGPAARGTRTRGSREPAPRLPVGIHAGRQDRPLDRRHDRGRARDLRAAGRRRRRARGTGRSASASRPARRASRALDRRYLASVDSGDVVAKLPEDARRGGGARLLRRGRARPRGLQAHVETPFDFDAFLADPSAHAPSSRR